MLIHSGTLVSMDAARTVVAGDLLVVDDRIVARGAGVAAARRALPGGRAEQRIDAAGCYVLPGFVQAHLHLCQTLFRGLAEQSNLLDWLRQAIFPLEAAHTSASVAASARLGLVEMIAAGVTCVNDMGTVRHTEAIGEVLETSGIRAVFGKALMDRGEGLPDAWIEKTKAALDETEDLVKRFHGAAGGRLSVSLAPRFILSCSDALWEGAVALSSERRLLLHTHVSESRGEGREVEATTGHTGVRHFEAGGILSDRFIAAHGVWLDGQELSLLARAGAALVHCPGSNLKLGSGLADVAAWRENGIRCGLGSDGAACNNRLDPFHEMSLASGASRARRPEQPLGACDVLALATCDGAAALGLGDMTGSLEPGKQADLVIVNATGPHFATAAEDPCVALVESARPSDVRLTMVAGRVLYRDGAWCTIDAARAVAEARAETKRLLERRSA